MLRYTLSTLALGFVLASAACAADPAGDDTNNDEQVASSAAALRCKKSYVGHSANECALIRFVCAEGSTYFSDKHGCGCTTCP